MSRPTPGPWKFDGPIKEDFYRVFSDPDANGNDAAWVCECNGFKIPNEANARLIASAPDLLEACQEAFRMVRNCPGNWEQGVAEKLAAAIVKALPPPPVSTADMAANHAMGDGE